MSEDLPPIEVLVKSGEGQKLEFKSSLRWDLRLSAVNKELAKAVAKTVAGFMNAHGGILLIGVSDGGDVLGIGPDIASLPKKSIDGFELHIRDILRNFLGVGIGIDISLEFTEQDGKKVAKLHCPRSERPVYFQDGERREFYVREGNRTLPYDVRSAHEYISTRFASEPSVSLDTLKDVVEDAVARARLQATLGAAPPAPEGGEPMPPWLRIATRRVLDLYLRRLGASYGWKRLFIVSPWISAFDAQASLKFDQFLERLIRDQTFAYVVTRPPEMAWHEDAVNRIKETRRASIALVPNLHAKLYTAETHTGAFALLGSANFTQQSLNSREIGVLVNSHSRGRRVFRDLNYEAAQIYQSRNRSVLCKAEF